MYNFKFHVDKELFPPEVLLKAAYSFLNRAYVHFLDDGPTWIVEMEAKGAGSLPENINKEFENELLTQAVRQIVTNKTHSIREILIARAMASTVISEEDPVERVLAEQSDLPDERLDEILQDWFECHE